jgi:hypothetical protein
MHAAALIDEIRRCDEMVVKTSGKTRKPFSIKMKACECMLSSVMRDASDVAPRSPRGALFQCALAVAAISDEDENLAKRLIGGVMGFLESISDKKSWDLNIDYFADTAMN